MDFNSDFKYDLKVGQVAEKYLSEILGNKKVEVKNDLQAHLTGNVFIEYFSRGKLSGISISEAEFYCIVIEKTLIILPSKNLKTLCRKYIGSKRDIKGGDNNTSKGILLPVIDLLKWKVGENANLKVAASSLRS